MNVLHWPRCGWQMTRLTERMLLVKADQWPTGWGPRVSRAVEAVEVCVTLLPVAAADRTRCPVLIEMGILPVLCWQHSCWRQSPVAGLREHAAAVVTRA